MILPMLIGLNKINSIGNTHSYNGGVLMSISKNETMFPRGEWEMCLVSTIDKKIKPVPMTRRSGDINMIGHDLPYHSVELSLLDIGIIWLCLYQIRDKDILSGMSFGAFYLYIVHLVDLSWINR
tara:strand:+ start:6165 stop:6536 length:372 start_codon:yes stop_codon:yes gene_type:complete